MTIEKMQPSNNMRFIDIKSFVENHANILEEQVCKIQIIVTTCHDKFDGHCRNINDDSKVNENVTRNEVTFSTIGNGEEGNERETSQANRSNEDLESLNDYTPIVEKKKEFDMSKETPFSQKDSPDSPAILTGPSQDSKIQETCLDVEETKISNLPQDSTATTLEIQPDISKVNDTFSPVKIHGDPNDDFDEQEYKGDATEEYDLAAINPEELIYSNKNLCKEPSSTDLEYQDETIVQNQSQPGNVTQQYQVTERIEPEIITDKPISMDSVQTYEEINNNCIEKESIIETIDNKDYFSAQSENKACNQQFEQTDSEVRNISSHRYSTESMNIIGAMDLSAPCQPNLEENIKQTDSQIETDETNGKNMAQTGEKEVVQKDDTFIANTQTSIQVFNDSVREDLNNKCNLTEGTEIDEHLSKEERRKRKKEKKRKAKLETDTQEAITFEEKQHLDSIEIKEKLHEHKNVEPQMIEEIVEPQRIEENVEPQRIEENVEPRRIEENVESQMNEENPPTYQSKSEMNTTFDENNSTNQQDQYDSKTDMANKDLHKREIDSDDDDDEEFTDKMFEDLGLDPSMVSIVPRSKKIIKDVKSRENVIIQGEGKQGDIPRENVDTTASNVAIESTLNKTNDSAALNKDAEEDRNNHTAKKRHRQWSENDKMEQDVKQSRLESIDVTTEQQNPSNRNAIGEASRAQEAPYSSNQRLEEHCFSETDQSNKDSQLQTNENESYRSRTDDDKMTQSSENFNNTAVDIKQSRDSNLNIGSNFDREKYTEQRFFNNLSDEQRDTNEMRAENSEHGSIPYHRTIDNSLTISNTQSNSTNIRAISLDASNCKMIAIPAGSLSVYSTTTLFAENKRAAEDSNDANRDPFRRKTSSREDINRLSIGSQQNENYSSSGQGNIVRSSENEICHTAMSNETNNDFKFDNKESLRSDNTTESLENSTISGPTQNAFINELDTLQNQGSDHPDIPQNTAMDKEINHFHQDGNRQHENGSDAQRENNTDYPSHLSHKRTRFEDTVNSTLDSNFNAPFNDTTNDREHENPDMGKIVQHADATEKVGPNSCDIVSPSNNEGENNEKVNLVDHSSNNNESTLSDQNRFHDDNDKNKDRTSQQFTSNTNNQDYEQTPLPDDKYTAANNTTMVPEVSEAPSQPVRQWNQWRGTDIPVAKNLPGTVVPVRVESTKSFFSNPSSFGSNTRMENNPNTNQNSFRGRYHDDEDDKEGSGTTTLSSSILRIQQLISSTPRAAPSSSPSLTPTPSFSNNNSNNDGMRYNNNNVNDNGNPFEKPSFNNNSHTFPFNSNNENFKQGNNERDDPMANVNNLRHPNLPPNNPNNLFQTRGRSTSTEKFVQMNKPDNGFAGPPPPGGNNFNFNQRPVNTNRDFFHPRRRRSESFLPNAPGTGGPLQPPPNYQPQPNQIPFPNRRDPNTFGNGWQNSQANSSNNQNRMGPPPRMVPHNPPNNANPQFNPNMQPPQQNMQPPQQNMQPPQQNMQPPQPDMQPPQQNMQPPQQNPAFGGKSKLVAWMQSKSQQATDRQVRPQPPPQYPNNFNNRPERMGPPPSAQMGFSSMNNQQRMMYENDRMRGSDNYPPQRGNSQFNNSFGNSRNNEGNNMFQQRDPRGFGNNQPNNFYRDQHHNNFQEPMDPRAAEMARRPKQPPMDPRQAKQLYLWFYKIEMANIKETNPVLFRSGKASTELMNRWKRMTNEEKLKYRQPDMY